MESHPVLSDAERIYILSQTREAIPKGYNISQYRKRIARKVQLAFGDFDKILTSKVLPQSYKDKVFDVNTISSFLGNFMYYDKENTTTSEEMAKQELATRLIDMGVGYYRQRYPATFAISHLNDALNLLYEIANLSRQQAEDKQALEFYKMRGQMKLPPLIQPHDTDWYALCMICWKYSGGETSQEAVSSLRHSKLCPFNRKRPEQYLKFIPPTSLYRPTEEKKRKKTS